MGGMHPENWRRFTGEERREWLAANLADLIEGDRVAHGRKGDPGSRLFGVRLGATLKLNAAKFRIEMGL